MYTTNFQGKPKWLDSMGRMLHLSSLPSSGSLLSQVAVFYHSKLMAVFPNLYSQWGTFRFLLWLTIALLNESFINSFHNITSLNPKIGEKEFMLVRWIFCVLLLLFPSKEDQTIDHLAQTKKKVINDNFQFHSLGFVVFHIHLRWKNRIDA